MGPVTRTTQTRKTPAARAAALGLAALLLWTAQGLAGTPAGAGPSDTGLKGAVDEILTDPRLDGAAAGVVVADAATGATLYRRDGDDRLVPASNTKIPTSAAAMEILGPDHRFRTEVLATGRLVSGVLHGDLYLRGTGDPTVLAADYDRLAARVAAAGVRRVTGRLVADDTRFDANRLGRSWAADDESSYYSAQISALTLAPDTDYDSGTVIVEASAAEVPGRRPAVTLTPRNDHVRVDNRATTVGAGRPGTLTVERAHGTNTLVVRGGIPVGAAPVREWVTVDDPTGYATAVFADALAARGVRVEGPTRLGLRTPASAGTVAAHASMPLRRLLHPFMKLSNNMHAEALTKAVGYEVSGSGSWEAGLAAVGAYLRKEGVDTDGLRQADGSGLSRMNLFPAARLAELLLAVQDAPWYADWYASLPVACHPDRMVGGTLRSRMCGTPAALNARGKTGTLTGASALSGYVADAAGRRLVYSVVLNNHLAPSVKDVEDALVVTLASSDTAEGRITRPAPSPRRHADPPGAVPECAWRKPRALC
ncbi:D-alanyl-D-alanine carboxypeptidase/D-alanyl-D-alanine-endopeptidase [Streptomyces somaliensis DSM 40738]|uniref:D-alanyl-D-alanine carboxypeptidase/D-alanyl-D-alanine-endopeptidase n=1 Tax=Streptomyces somaliensis (strain ATCC 33201 / DSM 40738 / JCM 12659 / KCTC 9044 / NCTC 11332 / NRRL B-12077 / IP 733) TaxID=1134445 RepID=A0AA44IDF5_STRE0|nr:D-alanyl-D-alanine carboxypeptidase/D-alanyl-D-alanine-endopeptidase [Streptomyces somaliensis]MCQ0024398.1 D-alanyl-D-alanine carboxypeptidase/D-alanyl-D-alanine-endopeptidase [Streptomyces somaliensis DSM 40738]NKY14665.1 D-alanyl-D-alanine carboxypeptidase/D-alanyl-D-alanine-endopeptidase [Streptomyces somaliensis DSM 40738]